jgi:coproporphyrinogen III oxidase
MLNDEFHALLREHSRDYCAGLQDTICAAIERADGGATFREDVWVHVDEGGGRTRSLENGAIFERAGVNTSAIVTTLTEKLAARINVPSQKVFVTGISLVLHPESPMIPTVHMNLRYVQLASGDGWFGGGIDLTPYYLIEKDAIEFHYALRSICERHDLAFYPRFKAECDKYFWLPHRDEARGIGGIFFDYLRERPSSIFRFVQDVGNSFLDVYLPIVQRRKHDPWGDRERAWQLFRRGRYVEFNLLFDRGTMFGLETGGRTESILISLPPLASWRYNHRVEENSSEYAMLRVLRHPKDWV